MAFDDQTQQPSDPTMDFLASQGANLNPAPPANNSKNAGPVKAGLRHTLIGLLGNFSYGAGQAMTHAAGLPTDQEKAMQSVQMAHGMAQTRLADEEVQTQALNRQMIQRRMQAMQDMAKGNPFASLGEMSADEQALAEVGRQESTIKGDPEPIHSAIKQITQQRAISGRGMMGKTEVTPEMVAAYPQLAPFLKKQMSISDLNGMMRTEGISSQVVPGYGGPVAVNKITGVAKPVTLDGKRVGNPQVETAEAKAVLGAKYGIAITDTGDTVSRYEALKNGLKLASSNPLIRPGLKAYEDAYGTDLRLKQMRQQAQDQTGASDMALLFNHIAMTGGNVKGMHLGEHITEEHRKARGIPEELTVMYNHAVDGEALSPQQRQNFLRLGIEVRDSQWQRAAQQGRVYGINPDNVPQDPELEPVDLSAYQSAMPKAVRDRMGGAATLPASAMSQLTEGHNTTFGNGQVWTKQKGKAVRVK